MLVNIRNGNELLKQRLPGIYPKRLTRSDLRALTGELKNRLLSLRDKSAFLDLKIHERVLDRNISEYGYQSALAELQAESAIITGQAALITQQACIQGVRLNASTQQVLREAFHLNRKI